jgi:hypothetical protein
MIEFEISRIKRTKLWFFFCVRGGNKRKTMSYRWQTNHPTLTWAIPKSKRYFKKHGEREFFNYWRCNTHHSKGVEVSHTFKCFLLFLFFLFKKRFNSPKIIIKNFCEKAKSPLKAIFILFLRMLWSFHYFILFILFIYFLCLVKYQMPLVWHYKYI